MKASLGLKMGQSLTMTPALQQAIRLLQLSTLELQQEIQQALDSNLLLEIDEDSFDASHAEAPGDSPEVAGPDGETETAAEDPTSLDEIPEDFDADWGDVGDSGGTGSGDTDDDNDPLARQVAPGPDTSLTAHLLWQAGLLTLDEAMREAVEQIVDGLDLRTGWLEDWDALLRHFASRGRASAWAETALAYVQRFDPPGIAARNLPECLRLQLESRLEDGDGEGGAEALDRAIGLCTPERLALLARSDLNALGRQTGFEPGALAEAVRLIRTLSPHPATRFASPADAAHVVPDVQVTRRAGRWRVSLNPDLVPRVRLNARYLPLIRRADSSPGQQTLKQHLQEARYFLSSLEARNETLIKVAQCIVDEQRAFLEYGPEAMRPLVLRSIAETLGVHESTVSRATSGKWMLTPRGMFELKHFFSSHVQTADGGVCSATAIQAMLRRLVKAESPAQPLSDSQLSDILQAEGIQVARRTVAKYREAIGIAPSHERRMG